MKRIISVVSGKGGVGKTTLVSSLGIAMKEMGRDVLLVDADIMTANLGIQMGLLEHHACIQDVLAGKSSLREAVHEHSSGVRVMPASLHLNLKQPTAYRLNTVLRKAQGTILIDSPPGIGREAFMSLKAASEVIVVTNPDFSAVADAAKVANLAKQLKKTVLGIVVNRNRGSFEIKNSDIESLCGGRVIGNIPEDENVRKGHFMKMPVVLYKPQSKAAVAIKQLAAQLLGEIVPERPFWRRIFRR